MAQIFRKQPGATATQERPKQRVANTGAAPDNRPVGRLRSNIDDISAELRKVTWPTREETRNLTIVVIGISAALGIFLGGIDLLLSTIYQAIVK